MVYVLRQRLDIDIAANIFASIIHHTTWVNGKVHMPYGNIITGWLDSLGIDVSRGKIEKMTKKYSRLGLRAFSKSKITVRFGEVRWVDGRAPGTLPLPVAGPVDMDIEEDPAAEGPEIAEDEDDPDYVAEPDYQAQIGALETRFTELSTRIDTGFSTLGERMNTGFTEMKGQMTGLSDMMQAWMSGRPPPQSSFSAPSDAAPPADALTADTQLPDLVVDIVTGQMSFHSDV